MAARRQAVPSPVRGAGGRLLDPAPESPVSAGAPVNGQSGLTRDPEQRSRPGRLWPGNYFELKVMETQQVPEEPSLLPERNAVTTSKNCLWPM